MAFSAKGNTVIIKLNVEEVRELDSGLLLPVWRSDLPNYGEVISVGEGKYYGSTLIEIPLSPGQIVYFDKSQAHGVIIEDVQYVHVDASSVLAVKGE